MKKTKIVCVLLLLSLSMRVVAMGEGEPGGVVPRGQERGVALVVQENPNACPAAQEDCPAVRSLFKKPDGAEICPGRDGRGFEGVEKGATVILECKQGSSGRKTVVVSRGLSRKTRALLMGQGAALVTCVGGALWLVNAWRSAPSTCKPLPPIPDLQ